MQEKDFKNLDLPKMYLESGPKTYFVFKDENEHVIVEADNAYDAVTKSDIKSPAKVTNIRNILLETIVSEHISTSEPSTKYSGDNTALAEESKNEDKSNEENKKS